jgi:CHAT domain-containing protein/tetratricopeptide (TPR) repeat protein
MVREANNSENDRREIKQAKQLYDQGVSFLQQSRRDKARKNLEAALNIARQLNNEDGQRLQVDILNALGSSYCPPAEWNLDEAKKICERSLNIARKLNYDHGKAIALTVIATFYYRQERNFLLAIKYYEPAASIYREIQDLGRLMDVLYCLQDSYYYISDRHHQAIEINNERLNIAEQLILTGNKSISDGNEQTGNQQVLIGQRYRACALFCLAINYECLGEYPDARKYGQQCFTKVKEMNNNEQAQWLQAHGVSLGYIDNIGANLDDANLDDAIKKYQENLIIAKNTGNKRGQANILQTLAYIYYDRKNLNWAWNYNEQSLEIKLDIQDRIGTANSIGLQGKISLARGKYNEALEYFNQSLSIMEELGTKSEIANTLTDIGLIYYHLEKFSKAEQDLSRAIKIWEKIRQNLGDRNDFKVSIFEQQAKTYERLQLVLITQNKTEEALEVSERGRARALIELLDSRLSSSRTDELTIPPPTIEQIKQIARVQNSTLVEYSIISSQLLYIWVVQPTGKIAFRSVDLRQGPIDKTLKDLVRDIHNNIGVKEKDRGMVCEDEEETNSERKREYLSPNLQQLHQILIKPIADLLPTEDTAHVIFIPQGSLFLVPFYALQDDSGQYLIEKHTILTASSIQVLELTRQQQAKVHEAALQEVLVLGNPTMPSVVPPLEPLPGAEEEAIAIANILNTQAITKSNGTKALIIQRMPQARFIHLATHGKLNNKRGMDSAIVLAASNNDDGLLTAKEVLNLNLNAELVVLSACDTGGGKLTGDGVIGLSRSFIAAGVPSVIVSLWRIPDSETTRLMIEFYTQLLQNSDKAQALRQATLMTIKNHPHPKNWAAFILIGEAA